MKRKIDLLEAQKNPDAVQSIATQLNTPEAQIDWSYELAEMTTCKSFAEVLASFNQPEPPPKTIDEEVEERVSRCHVILKGKVGRRWRHQQVGVPDLFVAEFRKQLEDEEAEKARFDALSEEEQRAEINQIMNELGKYPGLVCIQKTN